MCQSNVSRQCALSGLRLQMNWFGILVFVCLGITAESALAQGAKIKVDILPELTRAKIEGETTESRVWSFRKSYADVLDLGDRIESFAVADANGKNIAVRRIAPGEYESNQPASRFSYEVRLMPPTVPGDAAMVSWMDSSRALLMLGDLLPAFANKLSASLIPGGGSGPDLSRLANLQPARARIRFQVPKGWSVYSTEPRNPDEEFAVPEITRAVFIAGNALRVKRGRINSMDFSFITTGDWAFDDGEAFQLAEKIVAEHGRTFSSMPAKHAALILTSFPMPVSAGKWSAETRGATVTLLLGKQPSRTVAVAELGVPLTHELFHLWLPNGTRLQGEFGWFYEGFTIYQAARAAVRLGLLTFPEFLDGIARAYDQYRSVQGSDRLSLIDASARRWAGGQSIVYQKAMVVAFLYDLSVRFESRGRNSLDDVYRTLLARYPLSKSGSAESKRVDEDPDGNLVALAVLGTAPGMQSFVQDFVRQPVTINLQSELSRFGLNVETTGARSRIFVSKTLTRKQRDLFRELGYNGDR